MSRPRSRSPHYRRFPWEEPDFDPRKVIDELDGNPRNRSHRFREDPEEFGDSYREEMYPESQRRSPFPDDPQVARHRHPGQEFHHRSLSPRYDGMHYENRRFLSRGDGGFDHDRRRGGFTPREFRRSRGRERGRGQSRGRFRYFNPGMASSDQRVGDPERERRNSQGSYRDRPGENPHHDRTPPFKEARREIDDVSRFGYGDEEDFGGWVNSTNRPRGGYGGRARGNHHRRDSGPSGSLVIEYDHSIAGGRNVPRVDQFVDRGFNEPDFDRQRSPRSVGSFQKHFRTSGGRLDDQKDVQDHHFQDNSRDSNDHETRRSPNTMRYGQRDGPINNRGGWRYNHGQGGRTEPPRTQPRYQDRDEQRESYQPFRGDFEDPDETDPTWAEEIRPQRWKEDKPRSLERQLPRNDLDHKVPPQRELGWSNQKSKDPAVITEETLTIKVDMSRPINQKSPLCYSSDRQLSFDLVNVGRQRLDFLPMLEHSGTYRETAMHTGTFAQEIITLVHLVKEQYFKGDRLTLNQRFSAPQEGGYAEGEVDGMTLHQRFSSNRGFSLNTNSLLDDDDDDDNDDGDDPLFSRLGSIQTKQPLRGPGDLRHDLERRRQEKLEAVKVTIPGSGTSQRSHGSVSEADMMPPMDDRFSNWPEEPNRSRERNTGPRRGAPHRPNMGPQRWTHRFGAQRENVHNSPAGSNW